MRPSPSVSSTALRIRPPVFAELQARIDRLTARGQDLVPLHIGDTHLAPPRAVQESLANLDGADASLFRYGPTVGHPALREAVTRVLGERGRVVDPSSEVLVGNGGTHALFCAARAVLDAGDEVLLASPYWPLAPGIFTSCGAVPVDVPVTQRLYDDAEVDVAACFAKALTPRTKALYVISPNNPDGKVLSPRDLERIAAFALEHDLWVFSDEVYADTVFTPEGAPSIATLPGMKERTITLHSLSKSHALAGLRVGFVVAPAAVIGAARRVSTHTAFNVSLAMQRAGVAALGDTAFPRDARASYLAARDAAAVALRSGPLRFHLAEGATYLFIDFGPVLAEVAPELAQRGVLAILERAVDRGVLLAPGDAFGAGYDTFARLCFTSVPIDVVLRGVDRLNDAVRAALEGRP